jgi:hypothetical protein
LKFDNSHSRLQREEAISFAPTLYKSKIAVFFLLFIAMAHRPRKRIIESSDDDAYDQEPSASTAGEAQGPQILHESQNDDAEDDAVDAVPQIVESSDEDANVQESSASTAGETEQERTQRMIDEEEDEHKLFLFKNEFNEAQRASSQLNHLLFGTATVRFVGNNVIS